jgi:hypothetical protein
MMAKEVIPPEVQKVFDAALARGLSERACHVAASAASAARGGLTRGQWHQELMSLFTYGGWLAALVKDLAADEAQLRAAGLWPARWPAAAPLKDV